MSNHKMKAVVSNILRLALIPLQLFVPLKKRIVFISFEGGSSYEYSCNPKYVCEYMLAHDKTRFELVWLVEHPEKYQDIQKQGVQFVRHRSARSFLHLYNSKYIVTNGAYVSWFPFRASQCVVNTWHGGGAYKKLESDLVDWDWGLHYKTSLSAKNTKLFVSSSAYFTRFVIHGAFRYSGNVLQVGMPRNDLLVFPNKELCSLVKKKLDVGTHEHIVLYAPTFKEWKVEETIDFKELKQSLQTRFSGTWIVLTRYHKQELMANRIVGDMDVSDYPDVQELLLISEVFVTDYSSMIWDYSLTHKPCFLYANDKKQYISKRGFYVSMDQWPFTQAESNQELVSQIKAFNQEVYLNNIQQHHNQFGSFESGEASKKVTEWIVNHSKGGIADEGIH